MADSIRDSFASGEGIEDRLALHPAVLFQTDEIDGLMAEINNRQGGPSAARPTRVARWREMRR